MYNYTTTSNVTYILNTTADTMEGAEANCKLLGGHLAAFTFRKLHLLGSGPSSADFHAPTTQMQLQSYGLLRRASLLRCAKQPVLLVLQASSSTR
jgi:hypothetical protein